MVQQKTSAFDGSDDDSQPQEYGGATPVEIEIFYATQYPDYEPQFGNGEGEDE